MTEPEWALEVRLGAALEASDLLVTELLEQLAGERIEADIHAQFLVPAPRDNELEADPQSEVLRRSTVLRGSTTGHSFVVAHSLIAIDRLAGSARRRLEKGRDPIGRVLLAHGIASHRRPVLGPVRLSDCPESCRRLASSAVLARRYEILAEGQPTFDVREWFLPSVLHAMGHKSEGRFRGQSNRLTVSRWLPSSRAVTSRRRCRPGIRERQRPR